MTDKPKILVIDDDPNLRKTLSDILKARGYEPLIAKDGTEGIALLKQHPVNVALIDLRLSDISGLEVLDRVKSEYPSMEAIILTGHATLDSAIEATNKGAFSYLQKPYEVDQLMLHIRRAIEKQQAEEKIVRHSIELQEINSELKALYEISQAISRTIDMDKLFPEILQAFTGIAIFKLERKGGIFIVENNRMNLISHFGQSDAFLNLHKDMKVGDCLCGLSAKTGKLIISKNSFEDYRHTIRYPEMDPHGHIIVPLKAKDIIVGVLCLHLSTNIDIDKAKVNLMLSIGNQIGVAVENARLYEETKALSLHDPLTGLANRRLMDIVFERSFARGKRYERPLSVIMLDIDHFKKYNDTYGHTAGDQLLIAVAKAISKSTREVDLAVRYGGEEFFILLPDTEISGAYKVAERLRRMVEAEAGITVSLGISSDNQHIQKKEDLIVKTDEAMYQAKQKGGNRVEVSG